MKQFSIVLIILMLIAFISTTFYTKNTVKVSEVVTPALVSLDLNKNGRTEANERFVVEGIDTFTSSVSDYQKVMAENLGIDEDTALAIGYFAEKYAQSLIEDRQVKYKKLDNGNIVITFNGKNYNQIIKKSPFALIDGKPVNKKDFDTFKFEKDGKSTRFVFLTRETTRKTWITDKRAIFNADYVAKDDTVALEHSSEIAYYDLKHGFSKKYFKTRPQTDHKKTLKNLEVSFCAPEIDTDYDYSSWKKIRGDKFDSLSCDLSDEFTFYKGKIPKNIEEITLSARHLFAVYINGKEILSRNSYKIEKLQQIPETIQIHLDKKVLNKEENELTILVENLGFDKGFSGETNHPRGLVTFETSPKYDVEFYVNEKLSIERGDLRESDSPYLAKISANFDVTFREDEAFSK